MKFTTLFILLGILALAACDTIAPEPVSQLPSPEQQVLTQITALAGPNQNVQTARLRTDDNCYWFSYAGPVETTELPLLTTDGRHICAQAPVAVEDASAESLREGMVLTMSMIQKMMEKLGIEEIDPLNEKFDAEKHQAMSLQPNPDVEPNTVIAVMQKGYALNGRLIRPAMVMVSKAAEE